MIQKIKHDEYLKRFDNMSAAERADYLKRVGEWMKALPRLEELTAIEEASMQNILQIGGAWNDDESKAFMEGAVLLSAMMAMADTWLPDQLYVISAKRAVKRMGKVLSETATPSPAQDTTPRPSGRGIDSADNEGGTADNGATKVTPTERKNENENSAPRFASDDADATANATPQPSALIPQTPKTEGTPIPRPTHIDQYVHLLPKKTQERAAQYGPLMREMEEARQTLDKIMDDSTVPARTREMWAKKITSIDNKIKKIKTELNREWQKLAESGRVTVDDLGMAHVIDGATKVTPTERKNENENEKAGAKAEQKKTAQPHNRANAQHNPATKSAELKDAAAIKNLQRWLRDTRYGNGKGREEYKKKWLAKYEELLKVGGESAITDKIREAAKHYGIKIKRKNE